MAPRPRDYNRPIMVRDDSGTSRASRQPLSTSWKVNFRRRILRWYERHARALPWRRSQDPYHVWVSEIMLQQTQVATVERYFARFVAALPTIQALAAADRQQVLRLWEGLGYYRRACQMHRAAREIMDKFGGEFPRDLQLVRALPGIGRYTAGAILSIAFGSREPILEANSRRLLIRVLGYHGDPSRADGQRWLWDTATQLVSRKHPGSFNQALMELGSLVCKPRAPQCGACPLAKLCVARAEQLQSILPQRSPQRPTEKVHEAAVVIYRGRKILIAQRADGQRWGGLWDFPRFAISTHLTRRCADELVTQVRILTGVTIRPGPHLVTIHHGVTRYRITLDCFAATYVSQQPVPAPLERMIWIDPVDLEALPLSAPGRRLGRLVGAMASQNLPNAHDFA
jgi:A/G-specific adenine glycosylase